mmetsp:Transcript_26842/g.49391  ORF Transcript_26842/g.49391 Transcript_26842/m.49391 type:complete len:102 (+) Transcript_26842:437-742(+)
MAMSCLPTRGLAGLDGLAAPRPEVLAGLFELLQGLTCGPARPPELEAGLQVDGASPALEAKGSPGRPPTVASSIDGGAPPLKNREPDCPEGLRCSTGGTSS